MPQRQWAYDTASADPLVAAATDTTIVLLKVSCWSSATDGVFTWAGSGGATILKVQIGEDASFGADNLHLKVPAGEDLDLTISGTGGCTTWWYTIKELMGASPVK